jgi:hypothetical protein
MLIDTARAEAGTPHRSITRSRHVSASMRPRSGVWRASKSRHGGRGNSVVVSASTCDASGPLDLMTPLARRAGRHDTTADDDEGDQHRADGSASREPIETGS